MHRLKILFIAGWYPTKENPVNGIFVKEHAKAVSLYNEIIVIHAYLDPLPQPKRLFRISEENDDGIKTIKVKYGGIFNYIRNLIKLRKNKDEGEIAKQNEKIGFKGILLKFLKIPYKVVNDLLYYWSIFAVFRKLLKEGWRPDIIHAHVYSAGVPGVILGKIYKIPVVITEHYTGFPRHILTLSQRIKARFAMNRAQILLPVSDNLGKHIKAYGIENKLRIVPPVVNTEVFYPLSSQNKKGRDEIKNLLLVAILTPQKGLSYLLEALGQVKKTRKNFALDIVGGGPNKSEYEDLSKNLGLDEFVKFHGRLQTKKEVAGFMQKCDFYVLPSVWENLPSVLIEVMACGKPVITSDVGGIKEIINEENGILVQPKDVKALRRTIEYMLDNYQNYSPEKIAQYAKGKFGYEAVGEILNEVYRNVL